MYQNESSTIRPGCLSYHDKPQLLNSQLVHLRLDRGGGQLMFLSCACFLITQPFLNINRHAIHQIKAEYHGYLLVLMILYNSSDVKLKLVKEI